VSRTPQMEEQAQHDALQDVLGDPLSLMQYSELICFERGRGKTHVDDLVVRLYPVEGGALLVGHREQAAVDIPWDVPAGKAFSAYLTGVTIEVSLTLPRDETAEGELAYAVPGNDGPAAFVLLTPIAPGVEFAFNATLVGDAEDVAAIAGRLSTAP
jgi:hypothetical protein